jgi:signal transduction histidine kinase/DNA-binding response OmpR family regulator/cell division protein FtsL
MKRNPLEQASVRWIILTILFFVVAWGIIFYSLVNLTEQFFPIAFFVAVAYAVWSWVLIQQAMSETRATQKKLEASIAQQQASQAALERQLRETLLLNRVIATAISSLEPNQILEMICQELAHAFDLPQAGVALLNAERTHETVVAEYRAPGKPSALGIILPLKENEATRYVIENQKPLVIANAQTDPRQPALHQMEKERGTVTLLILPLIVRGQVVGTLGLESDQPRTFTDDEIALAQNVANATSQVLESARLTAELRQELEERRRAEAQLQKTFQDIERAQTRARALLDATTDSILMISPEERIVAVNWSFCRNFFGKHPRELYTRHLQDLQNEFTQLFEDAEGLQKHIRHTLSNSEQSFTNIIVQTSPKRHEYQLVSTPVRTSTNEYLGRLYIFHDVSHEREVERLRNEFFSMVSHELRTPLTSIKGYVDLLQSGAAGKVSPEQGEFLDIIKTNTDRLVKLINDLLDLSRIDAGRLDLRLQSVDVGLLVRQVVNTLRPLLDGKHQHVTLDLAPHTPLVWADNDRVVQILTNLISNAHKYTPAGGKIAITVRPLDSHVRVDVQDNGIGISPEDQLHLFSRFFRAKNRETQQSAGTGLGLAITRSLVEMQGGEIFVTSTPGQGSTFSFTLPIEPRTSQDLRADVAEKSILVVDENPELTNLMRLYLERAGYRVSVAHQGKTAIEMARTQHPDLITLELLLPDLSGFQVIEALKEMPETRHIPVMIVSVLADREEGKLLGAVDYLSKPFSELMLLQHVKRVFAAGRIKTVLVAQSENESRKLVAILLQNAGYHVIEAWDQTTTLQLIEEKQPDLILLELKSPHIDGIAILRQLKKRLPIIMMGGYEGISNESHQTMLQLGAPTMLTKPITAEKLATAIYQAIYPE